MNREDARDLEIQALRDRLSRLSESSLRINASLDFGVVLQGVLDSARSLTGASYGVVVLLDDSGEIENFLSSGMTAGQAQQMWDLTDGMRFFEHLNSAEGTLRLPDLAGYIRSQGLPDLCPPEGVGHLLPFLTAPVLYKGDPEAVGPRVDRPGDWRGQGHQRADGAQRHVRDSEEAGVQDQAAADGLGGALRTGG